MKRPPERSPVQLGVVKRAGLFGTLDRHPGSATVESGLGYLRFGVKIRLVNNPDGRRVSLSG